MEIDPKKDKYLQICDLQGFFIVDGGFLVGDTPEITSEIKITDVCCDDDPTTEEELTAWIPWLKLLRLVQLLCN